MMSQRAMSDAASAETRARQRAVSNATGAGAVLQIAMVLAGHSNPGKARASLGRQVTVPSRANVPATLSWPRERRHSIRNAPFAVALK